MMVGNEGKTRIPIYDTFTKGGFDPDKDLLQVPSCSPRRCEFEFLGRLAHSPYAESGRRRFPRRLGPADFPGRPLRRGRLSRLRLRLPR